MQRPDLLGTDPNVVAYIEYLKSQLKPQASQRKSMRLRSVDEVESPSRADEPAVPAEGPTTINILTASRLGVAKRTHRHLYNRQHRGGMGIFDLELSQDDQPVNLTNVEDGQNLLLFSSRARVYRLNLNRVVETEIRSKGELLFDRLPLEADETLVKVLA